MVRASTFFPEEDKVLIEKAIADAEQATSGEIVPVVATRSGRYDRAEDLVGIILGLVVVSLVWVIFQNIEPRAGEWASGYTLSVDLWRLSSDENPGA